MKQSKAQTLADFGEFALINRCVKRFTKGLPPGVVGIGDDCAVIPQGKGASEQSLLVSTDMLVEGVHFIGSKISPQDLGYKALAVNLSDIAAMGGTPTAAFLALALPSGLRVSWLDDFFKGWHSLGRLHQVHLLGGDTTKSLGPLVISVTILGTAPLSQVKLRSSAKVGDRICVTGFLGDSGLGLKAVLEPGFLQLLKTAEKKYFLRKHYRPQARIKEGRWLAQQPGVNAMMDLSDGLDSDLRRILEQSKCGAQVDLNSVPLSPYFMKAARWHKLNKNNLSMCGGEDYELLVTIDPKEFESIAKRFFAKFKRPLTAVGFITEQKASLKYFARGLPVKMQAQGYDHFSPK